MPRPASAASTSAIGTRPVSSSDTRIGSTPSASRSATGAPAARRRRRAKPALRVRCDRAAARSGTLSRGSSSDAHRRASLQAGSRQVSSGSSASTVPDADQHRVVGGAQQMSAPTGRLAGDPAALAGPQSRCGRRALVASFSVTSGRPVAHPQEEAGVDLAPPRRGRSPSGPRSPAAPQALDARALRPGGSGSSTATTARAIPAAISASAQGGVSP